ncbi:uncharacterized protein PHACADRAFT_208864 [Phanerochaete carnosa HHB-10118-sp]|uniref:UvrD-like helicase ATP-binding domain-containing protein n=1 Tax=Phanerochaete carnosa (strain HHB-10118-sp) TaxID=650164 RepID=K5UYY2_PHACS|nr:uncharacterized protein PHACADRAFT_208864 [Phanerochaete carnosa HHB-10118-sp]EKM55346.1 hypothetical protein PHACADRAFT_208864 [Phanerochaete carnosa HHB-10118-sp]
MFQRDLYKLLVYETKIVKSLQKFVTFSQALLNSILADQDVQHVFHMSPSEQAIVKHSGSCYVLGRSGTGKTTTMLFKMLGIERAWDAIREDSNDSFSRPRQVFVAQSRVLAEKVEEYYRKLAESHAVATRSAQESVQMGARKQNTEDRALVDQDEEEFWRGSLPKRFSELQDEHFSLFVTFDHLCQLLEGDLCTYNKGEFAFSVADDDSTVDPSAVASDYMLQRRDSFVSYGTFLQAYRSHLPQNLTKNLDPALIFAEIMGVIKGSESALQTAEGHIDEGTYVSLSHRQQGMFAGRREAVYELFSAYLRLKRQRRDWDAADRTHAILRGLDQIGVPGKKLDFMSMDEAQDNLLVDALVLRTLCNNPLGLFWAGDTAQTISVGSSFRFDDLKAFLYRLELASSPKGCPAKSPESFQLTINYRSHGGIVRCALSVVQLITRFWPRAIDTLTEEKGVVEGLKPIFFSGWDQDTVQYEQFLFSASLNSARSNAMNTLVVQLADDLESLYNSETEKYQAAHARCGVEKVIERFDEALARSDWPSGPERIREEQYPRRSVNASTKEWHQNTIVSYGRWVENESGGVDPLPTPERVPPSKPRPTRNLPLPTGTTGGPLTRARGKVMARVASTPPPSLPTGPQLSTSTGREGRAPSQSTSNGLSRTSAASSSRGLRRKRSINEEPEAGTSTNRTKRSRTVDRETKRGRGGKKRGT